METFTGISEAKIEVANGMPRLMINGQPVPPLIYFHNIHVFDFDNTSPANLDAIRDITGTHNEFFLKKEVALARDAGVHIYSLPFGWPFAEDRINPNPETANRLLDAFIAVDPEAIFILRLYPGGRDWGVHPQIPEEDFALFKDGSKGAVSFASDYFSQPSNDVLHRFIRYYEDSPYAPRILSYHPGGPNSEMFHQEFWSKGPDYSVANYRHFRQWLKVKYRSDDALRKAWAKPDVTFDTALIPDFEPDRFPMTNDTDPEGAMTQIFYDIHREQDWIDFSTYQSDIVGDRIIDWAGIIREETRDKKLAMFFYGYTYELKGSFAGHSNLQRVLECPDVDVLVSPNSYYNRYNGGTMNFMTSVDSVSAHGKLWLNEDDLMTNLLRTNLMELKKVSETAIVNFGPFAETLEQTMNFLDRNFASAMTHRAGTWWMDLFGAGAFDHPALWDMMQKRKALYEEIYKNPTPYRADVAVIADENSKSYEKNDFGINYWARIHMRDEAARSGATVAYYTLADFITGMAPPCKIYVFANAFRLTDDQIDAIRARLDREGATAYYAYAPAYIGPEGVSAERSTRLTGIRLAVQDGTQGSEGLGALAGEAWGPISERTGKPTATSPRLIVADEKAEPLARYKADGQTSAARTKTGNHTSIFVGDMGVQSQMLMRLFEAAGAHIYTRDGSYVQTDGQYLMIHSGKSGLKPISLPTGLKAEAITGKIEKTEKPATGEIIYVDFKKGDTLWFKLVR